MNYTPRTLTAIATVSLLAAFAAQANKGAEYQPKHHKEHHKNFFITGGATYLEPSTNSLDYLTIVDAPASPASTVASTESIQPEFNWGYFIQAGYRISHHYDIEASWAQYNSNVSDSTNVNGLAGTTLYVITSNADSLADLTLPSESASASSKQTINYSVFDANLGQYHDITEMLRTRIFAGINYAKVDATTTNLYSQANNTPTSLFDEYKSTFSGWGPEVGMDLEYKIWHQFGVVGHFAASFLIGQQDVSSNVYNSDIVRDGTQVIVDADSVARLVPALDAKLGVNWNVPYSFKSCGFGVEAGYQVAYYWDVIDQAQLTYAADATQHNYSNYGNMGPYLNLTASF